MKIGMILDKIDENQLFVPAFQREFVWKRDDVKLLIDSLIKEYPIGTMLTWETSNPPELKGTHQYRQSWGSVKILLDGQQRITSLYMLIKGKIPPYYTHSEITQNPRRLYVNLETLELAYYQKIRMGDDPRWRDITEILQHRTTALKAIKELKNRGIQVNDEGEDRIDANIKIIESVVSRDFPEQMVPIKATIREAIDIFYKVNASGVHLTEAELALAQICGYWPKARKEFKEKLSVLKRDGFVFNLDFIVYALLGCLYHVGSDMSKLHGEENKIQIQSAWEILNKYTLDFVMNFLRDRAYVDHTTEINSPYALIPIIVFFYDKRNETINDDQLRRIVKWFYYSQIRTRYTGQLPQKLNFDLRIIEESERPFEELLGNMALEFRSEILPEDFAGRTTSHPLFGLMRWYFKSQKAVMLHHRFKNK